jgi:hypothetical protein
MLRCSEGELTLSLRTRSFREAQWLAGRLDQELLKVIATLDETDEGINIHQIARDYLKRVLKSDMEERVASPNRPVYNMSYDEGASASADLEWIQVELKTAKTELRERLIHQPRRSWQSPHRWRRRRPPAESARA